MRGDPHILFSYWILFRCPYGSAQGFPLDGTKFHLDGPGCAPGCARTQRPLDPVSDAARLPRPKAGGPFDKLTVFETDLDARYVR